MIGAGVAGAGVTGAGMMGGGMMGGAAVFAVFVLLCAVLAVTSLLALGYLVFRSVSGSDEDESTNETESDDASDPVARLQRQYVDGELTEAEFERAVDRELADGPTDGAEETGADPSTETVSVRER